MEISDLLGRTTEIKGSIEEVSKMLKGLLSSAVGKPSVVGKEEQKDGGVIKELLSHFEDVEESIKGAAKYAEEIVESFRTFSAVKKGKAGMGVAAGVGGNSILAKAQKKDIQAQKTFGKGVVTPLRAIERHLGSIKHTNSLIAKDLGEYVKEALHKGTIYVEDVEAADDRKKAGPIPGTRGNPTEAVAAANVSPEVEKQSNLLHDARKWFTMLAGGGLLKYLFKGVLEDEYKFSQEMRRIAFATQGITAETVSLQHQWEDAGKSVAETGHNATAFQETLVKNLKKGQKSRKDAIGITKTELNLSTMLGEDASETAEMFGKWGTRLGMSSRQVSDVSRGIQAVAMHTGITGRELIEVVKSSEKFMKNMTLAGQMTAQSTKNIIELRANAEKLGIAEQADAMFDALSSSNNLLLKASPQMQGLVFSAAQEAGIMNDALNGTILKSKKTIKALGQGVEAKINSVLAGFGKTIDKADELSDEAKMRANLVLQGLGFEGGIEEAKRTVDMFHESSKSFGERVADINKKLKEENLTTEERVSLEKQIKKMTMDTGMSFLTAFDESAKKAKSISEAVTGMKISPELEQDMKDMGVNLLDPVSKLKGVLDVTAKNLKDAGGADMTPQIEKALGSGDMGKIRELLDEMTSAQQKLGVEQVTSLDPISKVAQSNNEINENIRQFLGPIWKGIMDSIGYYAIMVAQLGLIAIGSVNLWNELKSVGGFIGGLIGPKGSGGGGIAGQAIEALTGGGKAGGAAAAAGGATDVAGKATEALAEKAPGAAGKAGGAAAQASGGFGLDSNKLMGAGKELLKAAPGIILLVTAAVGILKVAELVTGLAGMGAGNAMKSAATVAAVLGSTAVIVGATAAAAKGLEFVGKQAQTIMKVIPDILMGALVVGLMAPAITALGIGILKMSQLALFGMDSGQAAKIAEDISNLLWATAKIAVAVTLAGAAFAAIGALVYGTFGVGTAIAVGLMIAGGAALALLAGGVTALASGVIAVCDGVMSKLGVDSAAAAKTAQTVSDVLWAAAKIGMAVVLGGAAFAALGAFALGTGWMGFAAASVLMLAGGAALAALALPVAAVALGTLKIAEVMMAGMGVDSESAAKAATAVADVLKASGDIAWSVVKNAALFSSMALLLPIAPWITGLMWAGGIALGIIGASVATLTKGVLLIAGQALNKFPPEQAAKAAAGLKSVFESSSSIIDSIMEQKDKLSSMASLLMWLPWIKLKMYAGAAAFLSIAQPMMGFMKAVAYIGRTVASFISPSEGELAAKALTNIAIITEKIASTTEVLQQKLLPLTGHFLGIFDSVFDDIIDATPEFKRGFLAIAQFLRDGVIDPTLKYFPNAQEASNAAGAIMAIAKISDGLGVIMDKMANSLLPLADGGIFFDSDLKNMGDLVQPFKEGFTNIAQFISEGIVDPVIVYFPNPTKAKLARNAIEAMAFIVGTLPQIITDLKDGLLPMAKSGWFSGSTFDNMEKITPDFKKGFGNIATFLRDGVIKPVLEKFPAGEEVEKAKRGIMSMANILSGVSSILTNLNDVILPMSRGTGWFGSGPSPMEEMEANIPAFSAGFASITRFLVDGIINPVKNLPEAEEMAKTLVKLNLMNNILGQIVTAMTRLAEISKKLPQIGGGDLDGISKIMNVLMPRVDRNAEGDARFGHKAGGLGAIPVDESFEMKQRLAAAGTGLEDYLNKPGMTTPIGTAIPSPIRGSTANSKPLTDAYDQMYRDRASAEGGTPRLQSDELNSIAAANNRQVELLISMNDGIKELVDMMKPKSAGGTAGGNPSATSTAMKGRKAADYGMWQFGRAQSNASRAVITDGVT